MSASTHEPKIAVPYPAGGKNKRISLGGRDRMNNGRAIWSKRRADRSQRQCCHEMITMGFAGENYLANYLLVATYVLVVEVAL